MSNMLLGIVGVILFIGLALAAFTLLGDRFSSSTNDAEAARYLAEGAQISHAYELYGVNEGKFPDAPGSDAKIAQLKAQGYLKEIPAGGKVTPGYDNAWYIDETRGAALSLIGDDDKAQEICRIARKSAGMPDPDHVKQCDASDIANNDPCCIAA